MSAVRHAVLGSTLAIFAIGPTAAEVRIGGNVFINGRRVVPGVYRPGGPAPHPFPTEPRSRHADRPAGPRRQRAQKPSRSTTKFVQAPRRRDRPAPPVPEVAPEIIDIS